MVRVKILCVCLLTTLSCAVVHAGELTTPDAVRYFNEGVNAQKGGNLGVALSSYGKASLLSPMFDKYILHNKGVMYARQGDLQTAEKVFLEILRIDPEYMPAKVNLGLIYDRQNDKLKALQYWANLYRLEDMKPKEFVLEGPSQNKETNNTDKKIPTW